MQGDVLTALYGTTGCLGQQTFTVLAGIVAFRVRASSGDGAITVLKQHISRRRDQKENARISMSLVKAFDEGRLDFLVLNEQETTVLCGELNGTFIWPPTIELADAFKVSLNQKLKSTIPPKPPTIDDLLASL